MNKKTVSLILTVCCLLLIIVISVLGKVPDDSSKIHVESIEFVDSSTEDGKCMVNDENKKIIKIPVGTTTLYICLSALTVVISIPGNAVQLGPLAPQ